MGGYLSRPPSSEESLTFQEFPDIVREKYTVSRNIGRGSFGNVFEIVDKRSNTKLALKRIPQPGIHRDEASIQGGCQGEHVVKVIETILDSPTNALYIVMELCEGGNLRDWMKRVKTNHLQSETIVLQMLLEICTAVESCHQKKVIHRDLKPENILLDDMGRVKLTDFGVAKLLNSNSGASTFCGTPAYMAPELYLSYISKMEGQVTQKYDYKCDVWSIGCILLEMASKKDIDIFHHIPRKEGPNKGTVLGYNISQSDVVESEETLEAIILEYLPEGYDIIRRLLKCMLVRHPEHRIDVKDILLDPAIRKKLENPPDSHWYDGLWKQTSQEHGTPV